MTKKKEEKTSRSEGSASAPDAAGAEGLRKIRSVKLSLHSDGINHWQDEPQPSVDNPGNAGGEPAKRGPEKGSKPDRS